MRACLLDREFVYVQGWGTLTREEVVEIASEEKPWDSIRSLSDVQGRKVCPVALVGDEEREWLALEAEASEYGRPIEWTRHLETVFRVIRAVKAEAQEDLRSEMKKHARKGPPSGGS